METLVLFRQWLANLSRNLNTNPRHSLSCLLCGRLAQSLVSPTRLPTDQPLVTDVFQDPRLEEHLRTPPRHFLRHSPKTVYSAVSPGYYQTCYVPHSCLEVLQLGTYGLERHIQT